MSRFARLIVMAVAVISLPGVCSHASAASVFSYGFSDSNLTVAPNESFSVDVLLIETFAVGDSSLIVDERGLFSAGVALQRTVAPADPVAITAATQGAEFDFILGTPPAPGLADVVASLAPPPPGPGDTGATGTADGNSRVFTIATFDFLAGSNAGETTTFTASDTPFPGDTVTVEDGTSFPPDSLDALIQPAPLNITVDSSSATIIPTPTAYSAGLVLLGLLALRTRRRRQAIA